MPKKMMARNAIKVTNPARQAYVEKHGLRHYIQRYNAGWRYSANVGGLDRPDQDGRSSDDAWMDGYLDMATDRPKWHLATCLDHDNCD